MSDSSGVDFLLLCHDGSAESIVANALVALEAQRAGRPAAMAFSGAALLALRRGTYLWGREFWPQAVRWGIADRARDLDIPFRSKGQSRELDVAGVLAMAREGGVRFYACPPWTRLLGSDGEWPSGVEVLTVDEALRLVDGSRTVIGSL
jgi:hypothetical protein